jgi:acetyl esterase/lipase
MKRRAVLGLGVYGLASLSARVARSAPTDASASGDEAIPLWPGEPPGGAARSLLEHRTPEGGIAGIARPRLTLVRPSRPDGSAVLIVPGGGYLYEDFDGEGLQTARSLAARGATCFVLTYRLPGEGWAKGPSAPLADAHRAMRLIRANVSLYAIDPARVGVVGFSAGGHLAALLASRQARTPLPPFDVVDNYDARPSFAALLYPVITMQPPFAHESSRLRLLGSDAGSALRTAWSAERLVTPSTPPTFLACAADDPEVAPDNTLLLYKALRTAKVPSELHMFEQGGHGFGIGAGTPAGAWTDLFWRWGNARGFFRA